jgi:serine/threonine protein kinase
MQWTAGHSLHNSKYTIEQVLGGGGFGITYRARDNSSNRLVAIKTLNPWIQEQPDFAKHQERFIQEAFRLARCNHPNIIKVYDISQEEYLWYIVMEFVEGRNLEEYLQIRGVLSEIEAGKYIQQIGDALTYIHQQGFLHRDVKPANIMVKQNSTTAILIDFGATREFVAGKTQLHTSIVTKYFSPLEQYQQRAKRGEYTDVYALAATYYYLVTKEYPYPALYRQQGLQLIPPQQHNPTLSDRINNLILQGMTLEPENRPQSIQQWLQSESNSSTVPPSSQLQLSNSPLPSSNQPSATVIHHHSDGSILYQLRDLLAAQNWQEADRYTYTVILKMVDRQAQGWIDKDTIQNFPCKYLTILDQLWCKYSQERFGFSIQKKLWQQVSGRISYLDEFQLGDRVGWRVNGIWLDYEDLCFELNAPIGHLPTCVLGRWLWSWTWKGQCAAFFSRVESCKI